MGFSSDYPIVPEWAPRDTGYPEGERVRYQGNIFIATSPAVAKPGVDSGWVLHDELYDVTSPAGWPEPSRIIAYLPTWLEGFDYKNDELYRHITHGIIAFLTFSETKLGELDADSLKEVERIVGDVVSTGHAHGARIMIALGGADDFAFLRFMAETGAHLSVSAGGSTFTSAKAEQRFNKAAQDVAAYVLSHDLDGVDLDLEGWWGEEVAGEAQSGRLKEQGPHPAGYALTAFAAKLRQLLPGKLISAAVFAAPGYGNNYDAKLADYVDWLGIMSYDLTGSWNSSPVGPHTALLKVRNQNAYVAEQQGEWPGGPSNNPIFSVEEALWYWTNPFYTNLQGAGQRLPRSKVTVGVPIYGYDFAYGKAPEDGTEQEPPEGYKSISYRDILEQFPEASVAPNANLKVPGSTPRPPFISKPGRYPFAHNIYFETPATAVDKLEFTRRMGATGVIIWELSNDVWEEGRSIIKALYRSSGNPGAGRVSPLPTAKFLRIHLERGESKNLTGAGHATPSPVR